MGPNTDIWGGKGQERNIRESPIVDELFSSVSVKAAASCSHPEARLKRHILNWQVCTRLGPCPK